MTDESSVASLVLLLLLLLLFVVAEMGVTTTDRACDAANARAEAGSPSMSLGLVTSNLKAYVCATKPTLMYAYIYTSNSTYTRTSYYTLTSRSTVI